MRRTDYLDVTDGGLVVRGSSVEGGGAPTVQFGDEAAIRVPAHVRNLVARRDGSALAYKGQDGIGYEVTRDGGITSLGPIYGDEALAYAPDGRLAYIISRTRWAIDGVARDLPPTRQGTSQGIREFRGDGSIRWSDEDYETPRASRTWAGIEFVTWRVIGDWIVGNSQVGCAAVNLALDLAYRLPQCEGTPWSLRGALVDGELWVASSMPAAVVRAGDVLPYVAPIHRYAPVVAINRPLWFGWFFGTGVEPSNCAFVDGHACVRGPQWRYVAGNPDGDVAAIAWAIADAHHDHAREVLAYVPRRAQFALPTAAEVQGVEAYLGADETDDAFVARLSASLWKCPRAVLIAQCYTSNATLTSDLRRVPGLVSRLARDHANVEGILVFSGAGRATGWGDHPEVHDAWREVFAGITGVPAVLPPLPPEPDPEHTGGTDTPAPPVVEPEPEPEPVPEPETPAPAPEPAPLPPPIAVQPDKPIGGSLWWDLWRWVTKTNFRKIDFRFWRKW